MYIFVKGCASNKKLYTEIGCKPIYSNDSNSCPVAYDCGKLLCKIIKKNIYIIYIYT